MSINNLTLPTEEQIFGPRRLEVIKKRGTKAKATDAVILLGGVIDYREESLENRTGIYCTKSADGDGGVVFVKLDGRICGSRDPKYKCFGVRPVLSFSSIADIPKNKGTEVRTCDDGVLEVEYGYDMNKLASRYKQIRLNTLYKKNRLLETENSYTIPKPDEDRVAKETVPLTCKEYEFKGKRFVRIPANFDEGEKVKRLSNGVKYHNGDYVWLEVLPVKWLGCEEDGIMITEEIIRSGVFFDIKGPYHTENFEETNMNYFIKNFLLKDLFQHRKLEKNVEKKGHSCEEANGVVSERFFSFEKLEDLYRRFLARKDNLKER